MPDTLTIKGWWNFLLELWGAALALLHWEELTFFGRVMDDLPYLALIARNLPIFWLGLRVLCNSFVELLESLKDFGKPSIFPFSTELPVFESWKIRIQIEMPFFSLCKNLLQEKHICVSCVQELCFSFGFNHVLDIFQNVFHFLDSECIVQQPVN